MVGDFWVFFQPDAHVFFALPDFVAIVAVPRARFLDDAVFVAQINQLALPADALAVQDVKRSGAERRRHFVFHHFHFGFFADWCFVFACGFDLRCAANVYAHGRIEFQRVAAGGGFGVAEHHADFHAQLVDEHHQRVGFFDVPRELAQSLAHQTGLQADVAVAHVAFNLGFGHQRGNRIHHHHVHAARAHQHIADFQRLFARVGLRHHQIFHFYAEFAGVNGVKGVFGINKRAHAADFLALGDGFQTKRGFA